MQPPTDPAPRVTADDVAALTRRCKALGPAGLAFTLDGPFAVEGARYADTLGDAVRAALQDWRSRCPA